VISDIGAAGSATSPAQLPSNPGGKLGKDEFLKMLIAQMKNQDPMNPMNGDQMAAQLAQFSSLEQLTNIGKTLEAQAASQAALIGSVNDTAARNILGTNVLAAGDLVEIPQSGEAKVQFEVGGMGGLATLKILDDSGREIGSRQLGFVNAGRHEMEVGSAAEGLEAGAYRYAIEVVDTAGKAVASQPLIVAKVDGVRYGSDGPILTSGDLRIPFGTVLEISN
jgi:flagellar basal-body rod modification protein FlgD